MKALGTLRLSGLLAAVAAESACGGSTMLVNGAPPKLPAEPRLLTA